MSQRHSCEVMPLGITTGTRTQEEEAGVGGRLRASGWLRHLKLVHKGLLL